MRHHLSSQIVPVSGLFQAFPNGHRPSLSHPIPVRSVPIPVPTLRFLDICRHSARPCPEHGHSTRKIHQGQPALPRPAVAPGGLTAADLDGCGRNVLTCLDTCRRPARAGGLQNSVDVRCQRVGQPWAVVDERIPHAGLHARLSERDSPLALRRRWCPEVRPLVGSVHTPNPRVYLVRSPRCQPHQIP